MTLDAHVWLGAVTHKIVLIFQLEDKQAVVRADQDLVGDLLGGLSRRGLKLLGVEWRNAA